MPNYDLKDLPRQVWANYHPFYGTPDGPTHRWLTWNEPLWLSKGYGMQCCEVSNEVKEHLRHDPDTFLGPERRSNYSSFYPTLGLYDCLDAHTLEQHARWAAEASLDGLLWDYMLVGEDNPDKRKPLQETMYDRSLRTMLEVLDRTKLPLSLCILYDSYCWYGYPVERIAKELTYLADTYYQNPQMLHFDNRLVIFTYATFANHSVADWWRIRYILDATGVTQHIFLAAGDIFDSQFNEVGLFDGFQRYNYDMEDWCPEGVHRTGKMLKQMADANKAGFWSVPVGPGFDGRVWHHPGRVVTRGIGKLYESMWEQAIKEQPNFITICSFNEWGEGTQIEPCLEYEDIYLKLTAKWAKAFRSLISQY